MERKTRLIPLVRSTGALLRMKGEVLIAMMALLTTIVVLAVGYFEGRKFYWDRQVSAMCAKDGGIKIYESIAFPRHRFSNNGMLDSYDPKRGENALGPDYIFKTDIARLHEAGNLTVSRWHERVFRRHDNKLLGETVWYSRGGGDLPGPWHPSAFTCPSAGKADRVELFNNLFVFSEGNKK